MKLGIMQPYFFPYIGYFQLIGAVDKFVIYDNIQYTKEGWINRNRFLQNGKDVLFSIPLKKDSASLDVKHREIATEFKKQKLLNQLKEAYRRAPYFNTAFPLIEEIIMYPKNNLFDYINHSIRKTCEFLSIKTELMVSSQVTIDHSLKSTAKVIAICKKLGTNIYINPIGGQSLYSKDEFKSSGIELKFLQTKSLTYQQFSDPFVPSLSIIDVMMFNSPQQIGEYLTSQFELI